MGLISMTDHPDTHDNVFSAYEVRPPFNEKMLPELIQGQISKLNELDASVKAALDAAVQAEKRAEVAGKRSAGRALFTDKKKEAIEELQSAGIELAGAVQLGAKAQKISFEFQTRLAEIAKYLFTLGVSNIAANRTVVRELEKRLSGASEEELSELAHQEVISVIQQLKEQEDLLRKQEQMTKVLKEHDSKIRLLLEQSDDLELKLKDQDVQQRAYASMIDAIDQASKRQQQDVSSLQQQVVAQQAHLETLATALSLAGSQAEQATASLRSALNLRTALFAILVVALPVTVYFLH